MNRVVLCGLLAAGVACGAAPPAMLTLGQEKLLRELNALGRQASEAWRAGRQEEAIAALRKGLALNAGVVGPWHRATEGGTAQLARWHAARREWRKEEECWRAVLETRRALDGEGHWRTADARWELHTAQLRGGWTAARNREFDEAVRLNEEVGRLWRQGESAKSLPLAKTVLALLRSLVGEKHPLVALALFNLAAQHEAAGAFEAALPLYRQSLALHEAALSDGHPSHAQSLQGLAQLHQRMGHLKVALPLFRRAVALREAALGERHPLYANSLSSLAALLQEMGDLKGALPLCARALAVREEVLGVRHPDYATSLNNLATLRHDLGDYRAALPLFRQALTLRKEVLGERHPDYATSLNNLAEQVRKMGDFKAALPLCEKALAIQEKVRGRRHPSYAGGLNNLALLRHEMGDHEAALPLYQRALVLRKELLGEKHPDYATGLNNLAKLHMDLGNHKAALSLCEQALKIKKEVLGGRHPDYANGLNGLASLHQSVGGYKAALSLSKQALDIYRQVLGVKHPAYATCLSGLAELYREMGDLWAALPLSRQALALKEEVLGGRHPDYATSLNNLALLRHEMGDHEAALPLYQRALVLRKELLGEKHPDYASSLQNLAGLHYAMGDLDAAIPLLRQALGLLEERSGERHAHYATGLNNLATLLHTKGGHAAALPLYRRALAIQSETNADKGPSRASTLNNLAIVHLSMGRPGTALLLQEQSLHIIRRHLNVMASVQSERQQIAAADALRDSLHWRLSIPDEAAHFGHTHVLSWKGASFAAQMTRRLFLQSRADPATRPLAEELRDATLSLALLSSRGGPGVQERLRDYTLLKEQKEGRLAELSEPFRELLKPPPSEAFRRTLPRGAVLVDWLAYTGYDPTRPVGGQERQRRFSAWVVRPDAATVRLDLGPTGPIEKDIDAWREAIDRGGGAGAAARLRESLWRPLEKYLGDAKVVLLSPDGALGRLPFAALPGRERGKYLLEEVPLAVLPVPRVLGQLLRPATSKASLLALGGVDYGEGGDWPPLSATGAEADAVAARFRERLKGVVSLLTGGKATPAAVRETLHRHRFAHLATHGYFAPASMRSALDRDTPPGARGFFGREGVAGWSPGLLSGLVLAGANRSSPENDATLTALEIAEMDLSGMELAVLSACQTGLGKVAAGEGMLGLQRAFAVAGCKSVVSSLWSVDDAATAVLMERFYLHLWDRKLPKLESMRQAQLDVLRHPDLVEARVKKLVGVRGLRGLGEAVEVTIAGKKERHSPVAWWAAWQLSGDWR